MKVPANIVSLNVSKECVTLMIVLKQEEHSLSIKTA